MAVKLLFGRECKCGCGVVVGGRQKYATNACRQKAYRDRERRRIVEAWKEWRRKNPKSILSLRAFRLGDRSRTIER